MTKLSIIVPVYNAEQYLDECIQSIIQQTYTNWELFLINDGSTDKSLRICSDYALTDKRITVYTQENKGQAAARNRGLQSATGKYISFIDSDDSISIDLFAKNIAILEADQSIDFVQFPLFRDYGSARETIRVQKTRIIAGKTDLYENWLDKNNISWIVCDKIFKRDLLLTLRFQEGMVYEDNYLMVDVMATVNKVYTSIDGMYFYHFRQNSTTTSPLSMQKELDTVKVLCHLLENLDSNNQTQLFLKYLIRIADIEKSLYFNFGRNSFQSSLYLKTISNFKIVTSKVKLKDQIKLLVAKYKSK